MTFFSIACVVAILAAYLLTRVVMIIEESEKEKRGQKMIDAAKAYENSFYMNIDLDVYAVCTAEAFLKSLDDHMKKVAGGEIKEWDKVVCYARPLFTFAGSEQTLRPVHTGLLVDLENKIKLVLQDVSGIDPNTVDEKDYNKAMQIVVKRDKRLFVPYSGKASAAENRFYGKTTLEEALQALSSYKR